MKKLLPKSEKIAQWPSDGRKINIKKFNMCTPLFKSRKFNDVEESH